VKKTFVITITVDVNEKPDRPFGPCCIDSLSDEERARGVSMGCNCPYTRGVNICRSRGQTSGKAHSRGESRSQTSSESS
jgi:hypothetical protein